MTDEEIICEFMEPRPEKNPWDYALGQKYTDWWTATMDGYKAALTVCGGREALGRLYEVEARLTHSQIGHYVSHLASISGLIGPSPWKFVHATAAQKVKALVTVLRQCNQTSH